MKNPGKQTDSIIHIFTDGSGCRPDGEGSGFAWLREDNGERKVIRENNLTNNQAEYRGILLAIDSLQPGAKAKISTDSENTCCQLRGERRVRDPHLAQLHAQIRATIKKNRLTVTFAWIPRKQNPAGKLI